MSLKRGGYAGTGVPGVELDTVGAEFFSDLEENMAAVAAAPVAAETPAMIARVVFDIFSL